MLAGGLRVLKLHRLLARAGLRLLNARRYDTAELYLQIASRIAPEDVEIWIWLGTALQSRHCLPAAIEAFNKAIALAPDNEEAQQRLGHAAIDDEDWPLAIQQFQIMLERHPGSPEFHYHLGNSFLGIGELHEAIYQFQAALAVEEVASTHNGLALVLTELGRQVESIHHFRRAAELSGRPMYISNYLFTLCYDPRPDPAGLYREHLAQAARFPVQQARQWPQSFTSERRLRVGYVSPDMRFHPVAFFLEPVLREHDASQFDIYCYSTQMQRNSETTLRLKALAGHWQEFDDPEAEVVAEAILADQIDILVDLAGHTANNSLPLLARRLAPVQVSWLGYLNTTGLASMDYRLTDATACPPEFAADLHTEQLAYLPDSQWCYLAPAEAPPVAPAPCLTTGLITFGALHNPAKIGPAVIDLWAALLRAVPQSRLLIAARGFDRIADETRARFVGLGVAADRVEIRDRVPFADYLALHAEIDINLDAFPYTGGTTTCHSLWMGVPVLTLASETVMGRGGASALTSAGLPDWVAHSPEQYLAIAQAKAADFEGLANLRAALRQQTQASPLMQAARFTQALEAQYRTMWQKHCNHGREIQQAA